VNHPEDVAPPISANSAFITNTLPKHSITHFAKFEKKKEITNFKQESQRFYLENLLENQKV